MTVTKEIGFPSRHSNKSMKPRYNENDGFPNFQSLILIDVKNRSLKPRKLKISRTQQSYFNILLIKCTFLRVLCIIIWCSSYARESTLTFFLGTLHTSGQDGAILACKTHERFRPRLYRAMFNRSLRTCFILHRPVCKLGYFTNQFSNGNYVFIVSITKFSIVISSLRAYLSRNRCVITWVSNYRYPMRTFVIGSL